MNRTYIDLCMENKKILNELWKKRGYKKGDCYFRSEIILPIYDDGIGYIVYREKPYYTDMTMLTWLPSLEDIHEELEKQGFCYFGYVKAKDGTYKMTHTQEAIMVKDCSAIKEAALKRLLKILKEGNNG